MLTVAALAFGAWLFTALLVSTLAGGPGSTSLNVLILGSDQRPDERGDPGRTDTLMVLAVQHLGVDLSLVSVPRDLWVAIPGFGEGRVNTAYRSGELATAGDGGRLAKRVVGETLGLRMDRFLLVNMDAVRELVDALGGIDVDNPQPLHDEAYPTDDYRYRSIDIPAGRQHLDGDLALAYARSRHQDSDFGRMVRQQQVVAGIAGRLLRPTALPRLPRVLAITLSAIRTDLSPLDIALLAPAGLALPLGRARTLVIGPGQTRSVVGNDGASLLAPTAALQAAVKAVLNGGSTRG